MEVSLAQLRSLVALAKTGSFTAAAELIHRTQPAISFQIKQMEETLGLDLVERGGRGIRLTSIASELAPEISKLLIELDHLLGAARKLGTLEFGVIRIGCVPSVAAQFLPRKIASFRKSFPKVRFMVWDEDEATVARMVRNGEVDFGITSKMSIPPDLEAADIIDDPVRAVYAIGHPIGDANPLNVEELSRHDLIVLRTGGGLRSIVEEGFARQRRTLFPIYEVNYYTTALSLAQSGLGVALLASSIDHTLYPHIRAREIEAPGFIRTISIARRAGTVFAPATNKFLEILIESEILRDDLNYPQKK